MALTAGIVALILAPEVYLPLRTVGERFHAAEDGMAAAERAFAVLDEPDARASTVRCGRRGRGRVELHGSVSASRGRPGAARLTPRRRARARDGADRAQRCGKSTCAAGDPRVSSQPDAGRVRGGVAPRGRRPGSAVVVRTVAWLPQRPRAARRDLRENLELARATPASTSDVSCRDGFDEVLRGPAVGLGDASSGPAERTVARSAAAPRADPGAGRPASRCCCSTSRPRTSTRTERRGCWRIACKRGRSRCDGRGRGRIDRPCSPPPTS